MDMEDLLVLSDIKKCYPGKEVLKGVDLSIKEGTVHGFLGPNGAGKSTLMNIILGQLDNDAGIIDYSQNLTIGYLPENPPLYYEMTVVDYLRFVQEIYDYKDEQRLEHVINVCGLKEVEKRLISHLSKGFKQRVGIAQALCHNPKLLVLDEPMVGLDPHALLMMKDIIRDLAKDHTIFISSHQLYELSQICSHISILHHGKIIQHGTIEEIEKQVKKEQAVEVELAQSADQLISEFCQNNNAQSEQIGKTKYLIKHHADKDLRVLLGDFFLSKQISVLAMTERKMDLEEIFKAVTKEEIQ
jgi:ABC-2 type transport system ATP-binding protein